MGWRRAPGASRRRGRWITERLGPARSRPLVGSALFIRIASPPPPALSTRRRRGRGKARPLSGLQCAPPHRANRPETVGRGTCARPKRHGAGEGGSPSGRAPVSRRPLAGSGPFLAAATRFARDADKSEGRLDPSRSPHAQPRQVGGPGMVGRRGAPEAARRMGMRVAERLSTRPARPSVGSRPSMRRVSPQPPVLPSLARRGPGDARPRLSRRPRVSAASGGCSSPRRG